MAEITICGAGIFGLSIAWECLRRGAQVTLIDPNGPASGSSGGVLGALAPHVPEAWNAKKAFQRDSLLMAERFWREVAEAGGQDPGYARSGRLQPVADAAALDLARSRAETASTLWEGHATWEVIPATGAPWEPLSPTGWLIRDTLSAHLHPRRACAALVAALQARGCPVLAEGALKGPVIWATGLAGLEALGATRPRSVGTGVKGQAALLGYGAAGLPQIFADTVHIVPHLDGTVAVGSTSERLFDDPASTDEQLDALIDTARRALPALAAAPVLDRWAGVRPRARSRAPMLGPWPGRPGHFIANGGFKIGFGMACKVASTMADLVLEGVDTIPQGFHVEDSF